MPAGFPHETELVFAYPDPEYARVVAASVAREAGEVADGRSRAAVERDGDTVTVRLRARDLGALRAGGNTWCSLVETAERVADGRDGEGDGDG